jgi:hypothetical protein
VAEQQLDGPQVGASFEQMCGEAVSKSMRMQRLVDSGALGGFPTGVPDDLVADGVVDGDDIRVGPDPARRWDLILDRICAREAEIEAGIDGPTVRKILERLSTVARGGTNGLGPLSPEQLVTAFSEVCGYQPDEKGMVLLQRLPGLGIERADEGTRTFVDGDFSRRVSIRRCNCVCR